MPIRLPVTMNRRWLQMTALGAADVPDVKMSPHSVSGSGSSPGSAARDAGEGIVERLAHARHRVAAVDEAAGDEQIVGLGRQASHDRLEQRRVARLGHDQPHVRVLDVVQEVLVAPRVVEPDDRRTRQRGAAEREEIVGRVVEQHPDVQRPAGRARGRERAGPSATPRRRTRRASTRGRRTSPPADRGWSRRWRCGAAARPRWAPASAPVPAAEPPGASRRSPVP